MNTYKKLSLYLVLATPLLSNADAPNINITDEMDDPTDGLYQNMHQPEKPKPTNAATELKQAGTPQVPSTPQTTAKTTTSTKKEQSTTSKNQAPQVDPKKAQKNALQSEITNAESKLKQAQQDLDRQLATIKAFYPTQIEPKTEEEKCIQLVEQIQLNQGHEAGCEDAIRVCEQKIKRSLLGKTIAFTAAGLNAGLYAAAKMGVTTAQVITDRIPYSDVVLTGLELATLGAVLAFHIQADEATSSKQREKSLLEKHIDIKNRLVEIALNVSQAVTQKEQAEQELAELKSKLAQL